MKVLVIGGGAAGMMAGLTAASKGHDVTIIEKNNKLGKKLFLTGKGRCNLTNACDMEELFANIVTNPKFLYSSLYDFDNHRTMEFFEKLGLPIKTERGNRVFPISDHSSDVIKVLEKALLKTGVIVKYNTEVVDIVVREYSKMDYDDLHDNNKKNNSRKKNKSGFNYSICGIEINDGSVILCDAVIMATGGASYPSTGSDGSAFGILEKHDIDITTLYPALVPFNCTEEFVSDMSGLSLKNVSIELLSGNKVIYQGFGEMLFTHFGVSGPLVLSASSYYSKKNNDDRAELNIDLKPAMTHKELDERILRDFSGIMNKQFKNSLSALLPSAIIPSVIKMTGINPDKQVNSISKDDRKKIVDVIKKYKLHVKSTRGFNEAIITTGGVKVKEINPSTMESKRIKGLYFAGEMIDVDALTGGYNLQIAWSTAHLAGLLGGENDEQEHSN